jgi:hypothetical protein
MKILTAILLTNLASAQVKPGVSQRTLNDQVNLVRLAPRYSTVIKMPDAVSSVIVGDPAKFFAEHSEKEPLLVLVKPMVEDAAESNLLVTTVKGRQVSFVLRSEGAGSRAVDFVLVYRPNGTFLIEESRLGAAEVPVTIHKTALKKESSSNANLDESPKRDPLDQLLDRQRRSTIPVLYGMRPPTTEGKGERVLAGVSEVVDQGRTVVVLFSIVNPQSIAIEVSPPQIQLASRKRTGFIVRRDRWGTSEQLPVHDYRLTRRRLGPGERVDGVAIFLRPSFKQSNESVFLQVAESGAIDKPALAPIGFGVSALRKEAGDDE